MVPQRQIALLPTVERLKPAGALKTGLGLLLGMSLLLAGFFAFWNWDLGYPALSGDEAFVAIMAEQPVSYLFQRLNSDEPHPPLYYLIRRGWRLLTSGHHEFVDRYPSVLIGVLLLSLTYRLGRDLGLQRRAAAAATILVGLNPQITVHVREARMYGPMIATAVAAAIVAWRFERLPRRTAIGIVAAVSLLALLTHYFNSLFVGGFGLWGIIIYTGEARRRWLISQGVVWSAFALWLPLFGRGFFNPSSLTQGKTWSYILPPWDSLARLATVGAFGYRDIPVGWLAVLGGVLLAGAWLAGSLLAPARQRILLLLAVIMPIGAYVMAGWFKPLFHPKYMLPWLAFAALAAGFLWMRRPWLGSGAGVLLLGLMLVPTWNTIRRPYDPALSVDPHDWLAPTPRELSRDLISLAGPSDVFGMGTPDAAHCYYSQYYFDRSLGCELLPEYPAQTLPVAEDQVDALLAGHAVLWYLDFYNPAWNPQKAAETALGQRALALGTESLAGRTLQLYTSANTVRQQIRPVKVRFGQDAELEGAWTTRGRAVHLVLVWRALANHPAVNAKVFVHLVDPDGQLIAQDDSIPVAWTRPLGTWQLGEQLLDAHTLEPSAGLPSAGAALRVGLYDADTSVRLAAYDATGTRLPDDYALVPLNP